MEQEHKYATKIRPNCQQDFCWACCGGTNTHAGGKHGPDFMLCPKCGHDYYEEESQWPERVYNLTIQELCKVL